MKLDKWVVVKWLKKKGERSGKAVICPLDGDDVVTGFAVITEIPDKKFNVIGEMGKVDEHEN